MISECIPRNRRTWPAHLGLAVLGLALWAVTALADDVAPSNSADRSIDAPLLDANDSALPTAAGASASASAGDGAFRPLDEEVQTLKELAANLNRDLFLLEEELLFPASTQVAVFVSMDVGEFFALDSVEVELDGRDIASYLYTDREVDALFRGGVQRLYVGNVRAGEHELIAVFTGRGPHERDYRRAASLTFEKGIGPKYVELRISDREARLQPEFVIEEWE